MDNQFSRGAIMLGLAKKKQTIDSATVENVNDTASSSRPSSRFSTMEEDSLMSEASSIGSLPSALMKTHRILENDNFIVGGPNSSNEYFNENTEVSNVIRDTEVPQDSSSAESITEMVEDANSTDEEVGGPNSRNEYVNENSEVSNVIRETEVSQDSSSAEYDNELTDDTEDDSDDEDCLLQRINPDYESEEEDEDSWDEEDHIDLESRPNITWSETDKDFNQIPLPFVGTNCTHEVDSNMSPLSLFRIFFTNTILGFIVAESNIYANNIKEKGKLKNYKNIDVHELLVYLGINFFMSIWYNAKRSEYWSEAWGHSMVRNRMSRNRYSEIERALHFCSTGSDVYSKQKAIDLIASLLDQLKSRFSKLYRTSQKLSLDESMIPWKGRLKFRQYNKSKHTRYGVKMFALCEAKSGYYLNFLIYSGADTPYISNLGNLLPGSNITEKIVLKLTQPFRGLGHMLYMDNYYNSPGLSLFLKAEAKIDSVGTLRTNRKEVPQLFAREKLEKGAILSYTGEALSNTVLLQRWAPNDKKVVSLISTIHKNDTRECTVMRTCNGHDYEKKIIKPSSVLDYNENMGGVDKVDQILEPFKVERKRGLRWTSKVFKRFVNIAVHNAYVIHKFLLQKKCLSNRDFRKQIVEEIFALDTQIKQKNIPQHVPLSLESLEEIKLHLPESIEEKKRKNCYSCPRFYDRKDAKTTWQCKACNLNLCMRCFTPYHRRLCVI